MVLHGVGIAEETAKNTGMNSTMLRRLMEKNAQGEGYGCYFDLDGHMVHAESDVNAGLARLQPNCRMIMAAGGARKARGMLGVLRNRPYHMLVTDEAAARAILAILGPENHDCEP